jgi:hypothetical protein
MRTQAAKYNSKNYSAIKLTNSEIGASNAVYKNQFIQDVLSAW